MPLTHLCSAAVLSMTALTSVGCGAKVGKPELETKIKEYLKTEKMDARSVTCPDAMDVKQGGKVDCKSVDADGNEGVVKVTFGTDTSDIETEIVNIKAVGDSQEAALSADGPKVDVTCPEKSLFLKAGLKFTCDATLDGKAGSKVELVFGDDKKKLVSKLDGGAPPAAPAAAVDSAAPAGSADAAPAGSADAAPADKADD